MFLGLQGGRDRDQNIGTCWGLLEFGFKTLFLSQIILCILFYLFPDFFIQSFANIVILTVEKVQLWRLISSILLPGVSMYAFLNVLFQFYVMYMFLPDIEKKLSTAFIFFEVLIQTFISNLTLTVIGYGLYTLGLGSASTYIGFGTLPLVFIFIWRKVAENPQEATRFCWFPCLIPMKYIPLCFLLFFVLFGNIVPASVYCALGYIQFMLLRKSFIRLPIKIYNKFDSLMPSGLREKPGYIKVSSVYQNIRKVCLTEGCCNWGDQDEAPLRNDRANQGQLPARVEMIGGGVAIGGSSQAHAQPQNNYKDYWKDRYAQEETGGKEEREEKKGQSQQNLQDYFRQKQPEQKHQDQFIDFQNESIVSDKPLEPKEHQADS